MEMTDNGRKLKLAILFGGRSGEHEVSLMSAASVLKVIDRDKYEVIEIGITHAGAWLTGPAVLHAFNSGNLAGLTQVSLLPDPTRPGLLLHLPGDVEQHLEVDVFFPVLHGTFGEDGTLQGLLELADVAYVGANVVSSAVGMDKGVFKSVMQANNIPVVESLLVTRGEIRDNMDYVVARLHAFGSYPLFIKPANLGSSVGISKCNSRADLAEALLEAARYDRRILVERGVVHPREIEVSVLGNDEPRVSLPGEIIPGADFYSYDAKYFSNDSRLLIPAQLSDHQTEYIRTVAARAYKAIDGCGMARVDFLLDPANGKIYLNEVNTIPGFTSISMYPKMWEATGLPYDQLIDELIRYALERKADRDISEHEFRRNV